MFEATNPPSGRRGRVLVVDDDQVMRELVSIHLRNAGFEVQVAADAVEGGHAILREAPDLVVCDVEMPYLNGYEFVRALKTHDTTKHIPVVFLTVRSDAQEQASKLGAAAYLRKPVTADRLLEIVHLYSAA